MINRKSRVAFHIFIISFCLIISGKGIYSSWNREAHYFRSNTKYEELEALDTTGYLQWGTPTRIGKVGGKNVYVGKNEVFRLIAYLVNSDSRFFVFTDFTALYAFTGKTSPQPLLWFHKGLTYSGEYDKALDEWIVNALKKNDVDTIVFEEAAWFGSYLILKDFPVFNAYLQNNFETKGHIGNYNIYKIKKTGDGGL